MAPLAHWSDELLACDEFVPDELRERILARGDAARERLLAYATEPLYRGPDSPGEFVAPLLALELLAELPPDGTTAARLVESLLDDATDTEIAREIVDVLVAMGPVAHPRIAAALPAASHPDAVAWLAIALACAGVRDEPTWELLAAAFDAHPDEAAAALGEHGDARALPRLLRAFDDYVLRLGCTSDDIDPFLVVAEAIEKLGGRLTKEQVSKKRRCLARQTSLLRKELGRLRAEGAVLAEEVAGRLRPGPNEPCPCGSGRKFKKCHEGDAAFEERLLDPPQDEEPPLLP